MKREEAIDIIRSVNRTCRGPKLFPPERTEALMARIREASTKKLSGLLKEIFAARREVGLPIEFREEMSKEDLKLARIGGHEPPPSIHELSQSDILAWCVRTARANEADVGRPCGNDFNEIVLSHPFDGQERAYKCPKCGVEGVFRSPIFEVD